MLRTRSPIIVRVAGRWMQGLAAIVAMVGLGAGQFAVYKAGATTVTLLFIVALFVALAVLLFFTGQALIFGRRWAWRTAVIVTGTLLTFLLYAVIAAPQPAAQRWMATAATVLLFGVPVVVLALPAARRFFARD